MIAIPENIQRYYNEADYRQAILSIVGLNEEPNPNFSYEEELRFHKSRISTQSLKLNYWQLLRSLWNMTWGEGLKNAGGAEPEKYCIGLDEVFSKKSVGFSLPVKSKKHPKASFYLFVEEIEENLAITMSYGDSGGSYLNEFAGVNGYMDSGWSAPITNEIYQQYITCKPVNIPIIGLKEIDDHAVTAMQTEAEKLIILLKNAGLI